MVEACSDDENTFIERSSFCGTAIAVYFFCAEYANSVFDHATDAPKSVACAGRHPDPATAAAGSTSDSDTAADKLRNNAGFNHRCCAWRFACSVASRSAAD